MYYAYFPFHYVSYFGHRIRDDRIFIKSVFHVGSKEIGRFPDSFI